jgi:hypothetical protein
LAIKALEQEPTTKNDLGVDCISRADAIGCLAGQIELSPSNVASVHEYLKSVNKRLHDLPSVRRQEQKTGHWTEHPHEWGDNWQYSDYECSICHSWAHFDTDFCPNCGAKMAESEET